MTHPELIERPDVLIIGAGPAGLTAARELAPRVRPRGVLVLEREQTAGGIPRHSDHPGYGIRDLHRFMSGPAYARRLVELAEQAGAVIRTESMVTEWDGHEALTATTPNGRTRVEPQAVILAMGARERPRAARRVPGSRPAGIYTTGQLQNAVHLHNLSIGTQAVVVGGESVSWSAVLTLRQAGVATPHLITRYHRPEANQLFNLGGRALFRPKIKTLTRVVAIHGQGRVSGVEVEHTTTGRREVLPCDTVVFTADWIPDNELARMAGIAIDEQSGSPIVDARLATSAAKVYAAGNLLHPVDTADVAALDGAHAAHQVLEHLTDPKNDTDDSPVPLRVEPPMQWITPGLIHPGGPRPPRGHLLSWVHSFNPRPTVTVHQAGRPIAQHRLKWPAAPGRVLRIPDSILTGLDPHGGEAIISLT